MSLSAALIVQSSHILAGIYFIFLKKVLDQTWKAFNTNFGRQGKYQESSYHVRQILAFFCKLVAPILGKNRVRELRVTKIVKQINF